MKAFNKVFGIGLPRCGGQSLQRALSLATDRTVWHSVHRNLWHLIQLEDLGAVEAHVSIAFLEGMFPGSIYIWNTRDRESWLCSCACNYERSYAWTNPLWSYPIEEFERYRERYSWDRYDQLAKLSPDRYLVLDVKDFDWQPICDFLHLLSPAAPFPNEDKFRGVPPAHVEFSYH